MVDGQNPVSFFAFKVVQDGVHLQYTSIFGSNLSEVATANGYRRSSQRVIRRSLFHLYLTVRSRRLSCTVTGLTFVCCFELRISRS